MLKELNSEDRFKSDDRWRTKPCFIDFQTEADIFCNNFFLFC